MAFYQHHALLAFMWIIEFVAPFRCTNKSRELTQQGKTHYMTPSLIGDLVSLNTSEERCSPKIPILLPVKRLYVYTVVPGKTAVVGQQD